LIVKLTHAFLSSYLDLETINVAKLILWTTHQWCDREKNLWSYPSQSSLVLFFIFSCFISTLPLFYSEIQ